MYELLKATDTAYYLDCPAKIGLVKTGGDEAVCIDSGGDGSAGRKIWQILGQNGWKLRAIYNTHSHADHIGGNRFLQDRTGCPVFAPGIEADFTNHPLLEPSFLYGGFPPKDLRHKFLLAQESAARPLLPGDLPKGLETVPLPGHSFDMVGFRTADGAVYLADCLSSEKTLEKYGVTFLCDVAAYLDTLGKVKEMQARIFIPAHAAATETIAPLAQKNIDKVLEIAERILVLCREPASFEEILRGLFTAYALTINFEQYVLVGGTLRSYLAWLRDGGRADFLFEKGAMLWRAVS